MTISVSGLGSGIAYDTWIEQLVGLKQAKIDNISDKVSDIKLASSDLNSLKTKYASLLSSMTKITDAKLSSADNIFNQKNVTSSNTSALNATTTALASAQTVRVSVSQLATATSAKSATSAASAIDGATLISDISEGVIKDGAFSIYVDNTKYSIDVASTNTLDEVLQDITAKTGLAATVDTTGKLIIGEGSTADIVIGSNADTTNFSNVSSLVKNEDGTYSSSKSNWKANTDSTITSVDAGFASVITEGTFTIGEQEFTINADSTLDSIIKEINDSDNSGVTAYWDSTAGKLVLESKEEGAININIEAGTSNFTDVMALTSGGSLASGSQTLGKNAKLTINGTDIISSSNNVTSDISGITGLSMTLSNTTTKTETLTIGSDSEELTSTMKEFVANFNTVMSYTATATNNTGTLYGESALTMLKTSLRTTATASVNGDTGYKTLASIGITTGEIGADASANTNQLIFDEKKFAAALADNPDAVKKLLMGDSSNAGVFTKMETTLESALDSTDGYFVKRKESFNKEITSLGKTIDKKTDQMETYRAQLETKFAVMDETIANLKAQLDQMTQIFDSLKKSKD